ncbi:MAG: hypothetical protein NTV81_02200 [Candidatus Komeilibacteria bacterium]|nr:hypothetical protein [Candidatus Komeilibacteria bacterium]
MDRYLKLVSWTALITGFIIITIIIAGFLIWQNNQPTNQVANPVPAPMLPPDTDTVFTNDSAMIAFIDQLNGDIIRVKKWGKEYDIKLGPGLSIVKTKRPIPIAPNSKIQVKPPTKTPVTTSYLKPGQEVKIISELITSSKPNLLATSLEILE